MKAARLYEYNKPLVLEEVPVPDIQPDEVLVSIKACGMCRSDVLLVDGFFTTYADIPRPITPGHEITGIIDRVGSLVPKSAIKEGDHVVVAPGWGDGTLPALPCWQYPDLRQCALAGLLRIWRIRRDSSQFPPYVIKVDKRLKFEEMAPLTDAGTDPIPRHQKLRNAGVLGPTGLSASLALAVSVLMR